MNKLRGRRLLGFSKPAEWHTVTVVGQSRDSVHCIASRSSTMMAGRWRVALAYVLRHCIDSRSRRQAGKQGTPHDEMLRQAGRQAWLGNGQDSVRALPQRRVACPVASPVACRRFRRRIPACWPSTADMDNHDRRQVKPTRHDGTMGLVST